MVSTFKTSYKLNADSKIIVEIRQEAVNLKKCWTYVKTTES